MTERSPGADGSPERPKEQRRRPDQERDDDLKNARTKQDEIKRDDEVVEETSEDSFPASDPPSYSGTTAAQKPKRDEDS